MGRQLGFLGAALLAVITHVVGFLSLGWLITLLVLIFLLWFPLRGELQVKIDEEISVICYGLPLPFWRIRAFAITRPYHWWQTLGKDLEQMTEKKQQKKEKETKEQTSTASTEEGVSPQEKTEEKAEAPSPFSAKMLSKGLKQLAIQQFRLHLTLGGSPMAAAMAGGSIHAVTGWVFAILSVHAQRFSKPDVKVDLDPGGLLIQGQGLLRLKTDLAGLILFGVSFLAERRRNRNGRKSN